MGEKIYKTMKSVGSFNLVMGILLIVSGITTGVLFIAKGARLLKDKSELMWGDCNRNFLFSWENTKFWKLHGF